MDDARAWLRSHFFGDVADVVLTRLGVSSRSGLRSLTEEDLREVGVPRLTRRRLVAAARAELADEL